MTMIDVSHVTMQFNMANDKIISLKETVVALLRGKLKYKKFTALDDVSFSVEPGEVVGIGVDFTSSTVIPVKADKTPLCHLPEFKEEPHAYVKLWKHHGAEEEAKLMNDVAVARGEEWLPTYGGKISSEWMYP